MVAKLTKRQILKLISKELDEIDKNEREFSGKPYFPVSLGVTFRKPSEGTQFFDLWFLFETLDNRTVTHRLVKMSKTPYGKK